MSTAWDRLWVELEDAEHAHARAYGEALNARARQRGVAHTSHFDLAEDQQEQNRIGAEGEVALYVAAGLAVPTIDELVRTMQGPDALHYQVRTTTHRGCTLPVYERDRGPTHTATHYLLMLNQAPRFAIVGELAKPAAWAVARREPWLRGGALGVAEGHLLPYTGPVDESRIWRPRRPVPPAPRPGPTWPICGAEKRVTGAPALVCTRAPGHRPPHGVQAGERLACFVTWEA